MGSWSITVGDNGGIKYNVVNQGGSFEALKFTCGCDGVRSDGADRNAYTMVREQPEVDHKRAKKKAAGE